jgi:hypothetical protein
MRRYPRLSGGGKSMKYWLQEGQASGARVRKRQKAVRRRMSTIRG